jgi:hypothetical protein
MAKCVTCGERAGIGYDVCQFCQEAEMQIAAKEALRRAEEENQQFEEMVVQRLNDWENRTKERLAKGEKIMIYRYSYITVDSTVNKMAINDWNFYPLMKAGLEGWQILGVVPKTSGIGLTNSQTSGYSTSQVWGGGMGGNVSAVYVLLGRELKSLDYPENVEARKQVEELLRQGFEI